MTEEYKSQTDKVVAKINEGLRLSFGSRYTLEQEEREKEALRLYNLGEITEDEYYDVLYSSSEYDTQENTPVNQIDLPELPW